MPRSAGACVVGAISIVLLAACSDSAMSTVTPTSPHRPPTGPALTVGSGFTTTADVRTNVGLFHVQSKLNGFDVELKTHDNADLEVANQTGIPGATSGWHAHPGPVLVLIKTGVATLYEAGSCTPKTFPAGTTFIEGTTPHVLRNDAASSLEIIAVFVVPNGKPRRIEADQPADCPF